ncbi:MAG: HAMP domain-containing sensor histidine kinase, partial [Myxococcota bacterium]
QDVWVRAVAGVLGVIILFANDLPAFARPHVPALWRIAQGFCIPFGCTLMLLQTDCDASWAAYTVLGLGLLARPGQGALWALGLMIVGIPAALATHGALAGWDGLVESLGSFAFGVVLAGVLMCFLQYELIKSELNLLLQRLTILAATHGKPLHEMSTPIQSLATRARRIEESWPILSDAYRKAKQAGLAVGHIPLDILAIQDIRVPQLSRNMRQVTLILQMFRDNMRGKPANLNMKRCSLKRVAEEFLYNFPFLQGEEDMARVECAEDHEAELDEAVTWQVLGNLLHNARHFVREKKRGKIIIKVVRDKDGPGYDVTDTLGLIEREDMEHLFDRFFSRRKGGSGLGLSYNRDVMRQQQGSITASCKKDEHTTFHVRFRPAGQPSGERETPGEDAEHGSQAPASAHDLSADTGSVEATKTSMGGKNDETGTTTAV